MLHESIILPALQRSMLFVSRVALLKQHQLWAKALPMVKPFYAVKSNNDPVLLSWIQKTGLKVDCASPGEMKACLKAGFQSSDILYANTMKATVDLKEAMDLGVGVTTTDSVEGVEQMAGSNMSVIVRLAVSDSTSRCPFSIKFGAKPQEWWPIYKAIQQNRLTFGGVSFHVGSGASDPEVFKSAIRMCRQFQNQIGCDLPVVDIGGGFLPSPKPFLAAAKGIVEEIDDWEYHGTGPKQWIAEPGRFFSSPVQTLMCPIVFKKKSQGLIRYTLDESLYGQFSSIVYDHAKPAFTVDTGNRKVVPSDGKSLFFGKTCDSLDLLFTQDNGPEYEVGDLFVFPSMGAYTSASATTFNGFALPKRIYLESEDMVRGQHRMFREVADVKGVEYPIETKSKISLSLA
jgi:ornithine decarboxylase